MKTYAHGEQKFWANHRPDIREWRELLVSGDEVKLLNYKSKNPSKVVYIFVRYLAQAPRAIPMHLQGMDWIEVINSKGRPSVTALNRVVPTGRVKNAS